MDVSLIVEKCQRGINARLGVLIIATPSNSVTLPPHPSCSCGRGWEGACVTWSCPPKGTRQPFIVRMCWVPISPTMNFQGQNFTAPKQFNIQKSLR